MSINLTASELVLVDGLIDDTTGTITDEIVDLENAIIAITEDQAESLTYSNIYFKFYDYWTSLTSDSETEKKWMMGDYVGAPVTKAQIDLTADGENNQLYPITTSSWGHLYPKRVNALYGTSSTGYGDVGGIPYVYGPYEYGQILTEEANQIGASPVPEARAAAQGAQRTALQSYVIPSITSLISGLREESSRYDFLDAIIVQCQTALTRANTALSNVITELAGYPAISSGRASYLSSRKSQILSRRSQIASSMLVVYSRRYYFIDYLVNQQYGVYGDYIGAEDNIYYTTNNKLSLENQKAELLLYVGG